MQKNYEIIARLTDPELLPSQRPPSYQRTRREAGFHGIMHNRPLTYRLSLVACVLVLTLCGPATDDLRFSLYSQSLIRHNQKWVEWPEIGPMRDERQNKARWELWLARERSGNLRFALRILLVGE